MSDDLFVCLPRGFISMMYVHMYVNGANERAGREVGKRDQPVLIRKCFEVGWPSLDDWSTASQKPPPNPKPQTTTPPLPLGLNLRVTDTDIHRNTHTKSKLPFKFLSSLSIYFEIKFSSCYYDLIHGYTERINPIMPCNSNWITDPE